MSTSRVTIQYGSKPYLIIAPHGYQGDDYNTSLIVERCASIMNCSAIINHGWQKSSKLDIDNDKANCNNYFHMKDVVADEFLNPVLRTANNIVKRNGLCIAVWIHGVSNAIRSVCGVNDIEMIFGNGEGRKIHSYTCPLSLKEYVLYMLYETGLKAYDSIGGSNYAGYAEHNMNQVWTRHYVNPKVYSFQLEIVKDLREDNTISILTAEYLAEALKNMISFRNWIRPKYTTFRKI